MKLDELNQRYAQLCQELGHLVTNGKRVNARIAAIEAEIEEIDKQAALLNAKAKEEAANAKTSQEKKEA